MKRLGLVAASAAFLCAAALPVAAGTITIKSSDKPDGFSVELPDEVIAIYNDYKDQIDAVLLGKTEKEIKDALGIVDKEYGKLANDYSLGTLTPYTTAKAGLEDFTDVLADVIPNTQGLQNVWAMSWIGHLLPVPKFGFGVNAGVSAMDVSPLTKTAQALGMDTGDVPDTLVLPTVTADIRIGGIILPFDVGFVVSSVNSSKLGLDSTIEPVSFDYFTVGGDLRYAVWKTPLFQTRVSVGAGLYYTSGKVEVADDDYADAKLEFDSTTLSLSSQISAKFLFFVPFAGARVMFSKTSVDWSVSNIRWANVLSASGDDASGIADAVSWGFLPARFAGGSDSGFFEGVRPVLYGGFAFDIAVIDLTFSASYDLLANVPSGAVSLRLSL